MTQAYRLQLGCPYIIEGDRWITYHSRGVVEIGGTELVEVEPYSYSGIAIIYPEHDLLWLGLSEKSERPEHFKTEKEFNALPRWEATRYAVLECPNNYAIENDAEGNLRIGRILDYALFPFDCRTGQRLIDVMTCEPVPGREAEVARLRRGIEQLMRGESFCLM
jgi:hypothetical protein